MKGVLARKINAYIGRPAMISVGAVYDRPFFVEFDNKRALTSIK